MAVPLREFSPDEAYGAATSAALRQTSWGLTRSGGASEVGRARSPDLPDMPKGGRSAHLGAGSDSCPHLDFTAAGKTSPPTAAGCSPSRPSAASVVSSPWAEPVQHDGDEAVGLGLPTGLTWVRRLSGHIAQEVSDDVFTLVHETQALIEVHCRVFSGDVEEAASALGPDASQHAVHDVFSQALAAVLRIGAYGADLGPTRRLGPTRAT